MRDVFWGIFVAFCVGLSILIYGAIKLAAGVRDNKIDTATATITGADHYFAVVSYVYAGKSYTAHMRMAEVPAKGCVHDWSGGLEGLGGQAIRVRRLAPATRHDQ